MKILYLCCLLEQVSQGTVFFCNKTRYNCDCQRVQKVLFFLNHNFFVSMFTDLKKKVDWRLMEEAKICMNTQLSYWAQLFHLFEHCCLACLDSNDDSLLSCDVRMRENGEHENHKYVAFPHISTKGLMNLIAAPINVRSCPWWQLWAYSLSLQETSSGEPWIMYF